jgi:hypothetical protein
MSGLGFRTRGGVFHRIVEGNRLLVTPQSSRDSPRIAVNYGVVSRRLSERLETDFQKLDVWSAHLRDRVTRPDGQEMWATTEIPHSVDELVTRTVVAAQTQAEATSDGSLRDLWLTGTAPGITEHQRLLYLAILLNEIGPASLLAPTLAALRGQSGDVGDLKRSMLEARLTFAGVRG